MKINILSTIENAPLSNPARKDRAKGAAEFCSRPAAQRQLKCKR
jgi:hypothetical protein